MTGVMRAAARLLVLSVVVAGCSALPPAGTRPIAASIRNTDLAPVELSIRTPAGVVVGGVQPSLLPARGGGPVTLFVPPGEDWWLMVDETPMFSARDVIESANQQCRSLMMEVSTSGAGSIGCS